MASTVAHDAPVIKWTRIPQKHSRFEIRWRWHPNGCVSTGFRIIG